MVQIISDRQSDWVDWIGEVIARLEELPPVSRMMIVADIDKSGTQIIEFMNCSTDDVYHMGAVLQKEAIKHEFAEEFGLNDGWDYDDNEEEYDNDEEYEED